MDGFIVFDEPLTPVVHFVKDKRNHKLVSVLQNYGTHRFQNIGGKLKLLICIYEVDTDYC